MAPSIIANTNKRLLRWITIFNSDCYNNMDHIRIWVLHPHALSFENDSLEKGWNVVPNEILRGKHLIRWGGWGLDRLFIYRKFIYGYVRAKIFIFNCNKILKKQKKKKKKKERKQKQVKNECFNSWIGG